MSKTTRIVATAIPHGDFGSDGKLHLSVALSPQLFTKGDWVRLGRDYYEVFNWPQYRHFFEKAVHFQLYVFDANWQRQDVIPLLATHEPFGAPADYIAAMPLWQQMLPANTPVSHWQKSNLPYKLAQALTTGALEERVHQAIDNAIQRYLATAPEGTSALELESFTNQLTELIGLPIGQLLVHPYLTSSGSGRAFGLVHQELQKLYNEHKSYLENLLLRLELAEVSERNINETTEFHKRFSAYGQHPSLLRRTGWLWDYSIDPKQNEDSFKNLKKWAGKDYRLFIVVDRQPFDLSDPNGPGATHSIFSTLYDLGYPNAANPGPTVLRLVQPDSTSDATATSFEDYAKNSHDAFWLAFLNELDVSFPLTAVELPTTLSNWRVAGWPGKENKSAVVAPSGSLFGQFREYVTVSNNHFRIRSRLVDRAQLFRRVETLVLAQREAPPIGVDTGAALLHNVGTGPQLPTLPTGQSAGYVANGITLTITNTLPILKTVLANDPSTQRSNVLGETLIPSQSPNPTSNETIANLLVNSGIIYQHNVQNGYRVDAVALCPNHKLRAGSLCCRRETYRPAGGPPTSAISFDEPEGWVSEPAQRGQDGQLYVDEELLHWNDWSLVTAFEKANDPTDDSFLRIETTAKPGSLVPLRFLWKYSFALRPVDICGNSARPLDIRLGSTGDWNTPQILDGFRNLLHWGHSPVALPNLASGQKISELFTPPIEHQRVDGVHQPQLLLYAKNPRTWDRPSTDDGQKVPHEHLTTLVVRSLYDGTGLNAETTSEGSVDDVRMLAPPRISLSLLLQHGVLDEQLHTADSALRKTLMEELVQWDALSAPSEEFRRIHDGETVHYLADPLADGFVLTLNEHPYTMPLGYSPQPERPHFAWRYKWYHRLRLKPTPPPFPGQAASLLFEYNPDQRKADEPTETVLKLRPGFMQEISLSCLLPKTFGGHPTDGLFMKGITQAYGSPLSALPSWNTPARPPLNQEPVLLVHAVEKPCLLYHTYPGATPTNVKTTTGYARWPLNLPIPAGSNTFELQIPCQQLRVSDRLPQATVLHFEVLFARFPILTSETYRLHAFTASVVCDRRTELGYHVELRQQVIQSGFSPARSGFGPTDSARERDVRFEGLQQTFPDTRYYRVTHGIEAISKFSAYFRDRPKQGATPDPAAALCRYLDANGVSGYTMLSASRLEIELHELPLRQSPICPPGYQPPLPPAYSHPYDDDALISCLFDDSTTSALLAVPSTARPKPPTIEKIVPLLQWNSKGDVATGLRVERSCRAFRIYFEGDWYNSGWGEEVAVLFRLPRPDGLGLDWGNDPLASKDQFASKNILRFSKFDSADPTKILYQEASLSQLSSQLGSDPISTTSPIHSLIDDSFFQDKNDSPKPSSTVRIADLEWDKPTYASPGPGLESLRDLELNYVCYPVQYASARQLNDEAGYSKADAEYWFEEGRFFVDIYCNAERLQGEYFPFLRFAIACHQPNSIQPEVAAVGAASAYLSQRFCFSKIVLTDFCQPLPHRVITIQKPISGHASVEWLTADNPTKQYSLPPSGGWQYRNQLVCFADPNAPLAIPQPVSRYLENIPFATSGPNDASDQDELLVPFPPGATYLGQRIVMRSLPVKNATEGVTVDLPADFLTPLLPVLVVAEYECHDNAALPRLSKDQEGNPRLDPRYRMVFSYVHCFNQ